MPYNSEEDNDDYDSEDDPDLKRALKLSKNTSKPKKTDTGEDEELRRALEMSKSGTDDVENQEME